MCKDYTFKLGADLIPYCYSRMGLNYPFVSTLDGSNSILYYESASELIYLDRFDCSSPVLLTPYVKKHERDDDLIEFDRDERRVICLTVPILNRLIA